MATTPKRTTRTKKSRAEVQQELKGIEVETDRTETEALPGAVAEEQARIAQIQQAVRELSVETVVQRIAGLSVETSRALADLSDKLVREVNLLQAARDATQIETQRLEELHGIDIVATSRAQLLADFRAQREALDSEIATVHTQWLEEQNQHARDLREYEESLKKTRQRERDDFEYQKALERKRDQDAYSERKLALERGLQEQQAVAERGWKEREKLLADAEQEFAVLRKEAAEFPARLQSEATRSAAETAKSIEGRYKQELAALRKEMEAEGRVQTLNVQSLEAALARSRAEFETQQRKLDDANRQVQEIALKAIEGASGAQALLHVNKIAMEQAKKPQPS